MNEFNDEIDNTQNIYVVISSITINFLSLALPIAIMQIYDRILVSPGEQTLLWLTIGVSVAMVCESILRFSRSYLLSVSSLGFDYNLSNKLFSKLLSSNISDFEKRPFVFYLDSIKSVSKIRKLYGGDRLQHYLNLYFFVIFLLGLQFVSWRISIYIAVVSLLYVLIILHLRKRISVQQYMLSKREEYRTSFIYDSLSRIHQIKTRVAEDNILHNFNKKQGELEVSETLSHLYKAIPGSLAQAFNMIILFGTILVASRLVISGDMTIGALTACSLLGTRTFGYLQAYISFIVEKTQTDISVRQINTMLSVKDEKVEKNEDPPFFGYLEFENVTHFNSDNVEIIKNMTLTFSKYSFVGIFGRNEDDLSELVLLLSAQKEPSEGKVLFNSLDFSLNELVLMPQDGKLFQGTIIENITMFDNRKEEEARALIKLLDIEKLLADLPQGLQTVADSLSNSKMPREVITWVSFARVLVSHPKILIINNTQYSLGAEGKNKFFDIVKKASRNMNIIWINPTNDEVIIKRCPTKYELRDKKLVKISSKSDIL